MVKFLWRGVGLLDTAPSYFTDVTGYSESSIAPKDTGKKEGNYVLQKESLSKNLPDIFFFSILLQEGRLVLGLYPQGRDWEIHLRELDRANRKKMYGNLYLGVLQ